MRVLVTRPKQSGTRTAERLAGLGFQPVLLPLTRIEPLAIDPLLRTAGFYAVAVTSANALRHAPPDLLETLQGMPCFTVGLETANAAVRRGFADVTPGNGDAAALAARLSTRHGARILYLCGRLRRPAFEDALRKAGVFVTPLETYDTLSIDYTPDEIAGEVGREPVDCVLVYSAEAAIALLRLIKSVVPHLFAANTCFLCISPRVAALLAGQHLKTLAAPEPTESSLISALRDISSAGS